jgi:hypothetical protein
MSTNLPDPPERKDGPDNPLLALVRDRGGLRLGYDRMVGVYALTVMPRGSAAGWFSPFASAHRPLSIRRPATGRQASRAHRRGNIEAKPVMPHSSR